MQDAHPDTVPPDADPVPPDADPVHPDADPARPDADGVRARVRRWAWPAAVALVAIAVTAALGGFGKAPAYLGPKAELKQTIQTRFWDYTAQRVAVIGQGKPEAVALRMTIRSKLSESHRNITPESVMIKMADESLLSNVTCLHNEDRAAGAGTFDPLVATEALCVFYFEANNYELTGEGPPQVRILILDQAPPANDFARKGEPEAQVPPAAHIPVTAEWLVT